VSHAAPADQAVPGPSESARLGRRRCAHADAGLANAGPTGSIHPAVRNGATEATEKPGVCVPPLRFARAPARRRPAGRSRPVSVRAGPSGHAKRRTQGNPRGCRNPCGLSRRTPHLAYAPASGPPTVTRRRRRDRRPWRGGPSPTRSRSGASASICPRGQTRGPDNLQGPSGCIGDSFSAILSDILSSESDDNLSLSYSHLWLRSPAGDSFSALET
jgi:hypothetical protein